MPRHIADKPRPAGPDRAARYAEIERRQRPHPATLALHRRPEETPESRRLRAFLALEAAGAAATGRHIADTATGSGGGPRGLRHADLTAREGLHPALEALHSRSRDGAEIARTRAFLRKALAETRASGPHPVDGPRGASPSRPARYLEMARAGGLHPSVRALRTRRGDATALIRLREFLRIARGETA